MLQCSDGSLVKPCLKPPWGQKELRFYEEIFSPDQRDPQLVELKKFMPTYLGIWTTPEHADVKYIHMVDITKAFTRPCVMDVKIGLRVNDPAATPQKALMEMQRFPSMQQLGFRITGMKVYQFDGSLKNFNRRENREFLDSLTTENILSHGLATYFRHGLNPCVALSFLRKLLSLSDWFLTQEQLKFCGSSILFVYGGEEQTYYHEETNPMCSRCVDILNLPPPHQVLSHASGKSWRTRSRDRMFQLLREPCEKCDKLTRLRVIDFAHVFPSQGKDIHFLHALDNLIHLFMEFLHL